MASCRILAGAPALALLAACGPIPLDRAEDQCLRQAELAERPRGEVGVGINSSGRAAGDLRLEVTSDYLMGRDPSEVYASCVYQKSGQLPSRPLYSRTDWKG
ncbi:hypothetical protein [Phaeovulum sp.]|uniref:hypothetical protein n=1 Tax=Phaeovulum sp. TaxID=2934796 RepID=UPI0039E4448E